MLLPYFGDFVPLAGSLSVFPIIFSATLVMTAMVRLADVGDSDAELAAEPPHCMVFRSLRAPACCFRGSPLTRAYEEWEMVGKFQTQN